MGKKEQRQLQKLIDHMAEHKFLDCKSCVCNKDCKVRKEFTAANRKKARELPYFQNSMFPHKYRHIHTNFVSRNRLIIMCSASLLNTLWNLCNEERGGLIID